MNRSPDPSADPVWAWVDHLRHGGTIPWLTFLQREPRDNRPRAAEESELSTGPRGAVPGAAQLELVRRLAERYDVPSGPRGFTALADRALDRAGPGRGRADLPLLWPGEPVRRVGAPATDPSTLSADELIRPGIGLLADLLLDETEPAASEEPSAGTPVRRRPWRRRFHLAGAPVTTAGVRASLAAAGHHEGGRRPDVVILAEPLDAHFAQVWSTRVQHGSPVRWRKFAARWPRLDELPPSADLARIAAHWAARVGPDRVHVVADPDPRRTTSELLGLRPAEPPVGLPTAQSLPPAAMDLLRRLNTVLTVRAGERAADRMRRRTVLLLGELSPGPGRALAVPPVHRDWLDARADALVADLRRGGYAVHGDLDRIAPRHRGRSHPHRPDVLALVLDSCLALAGLRRERA